MTPKDKTETGKIPAMRELRDDEIDSVSGGAGTASGGKPPGWVDPDPQPVHDPKSPGWSDPDPAPRR
jgi:hypothetical protein